MNAKTEQTEATVEASSEGSFGSKIPTEQVELMQAVMGKVAQKQSAPAPDTQKKESASKPVVSSIEDVVPTDTKPETSSEETEVESHNDEAEEESENVPTNGWPESAIKRTNKLTAQKKELKAELDKMEARLKELEAQAVGVPNEPSITEPAPKGLLAFDSLESLAKHQTDLENQIDWLDEHRLSGFESEDGKVSFTPEEIAAEWRAKKSDLRELPKIEKALLARDTVYRPQVKARFDWWGKSDDTRYQQVQATLKQLPEFRRVANHELILASAAEQEYQWQKSQTKSVDTKQAVKPKLAVKPVDSEAPPPVPSTGDYAAPIQRRNNVPGVSQSDLEQTRLGSRSATANLVRSLLR